MNLMWGFREEKNLGWQVSDLSSSGDTISVQGRLGGVQVGAEGTHAEKFNVLTYVGFETYRSVLD